MPFAWNQLDPATTGQITKFDIPFNDWVGIKFGEGLSSGLGRAIWDMGEDAAFDQGDKIEPAILNQRFGIAGYLEFTTPMTAGRAALLNERKKEELQRMAYLNAASHNALSPKGAAGFVAGLVGGMANPIDLGTAFIPFVGSAAKAAPFARAGATLVDIQKYGVLGEAKRLGQYALARGIVTRESLGVGRGAALSASVIDGVLSQAAVEIPIAIEKARNQADYTARDSLFNVLAGGLFAGGLNFAGQAIEMAYSRAVKSAVEFHSRMSVEGKEAMFREHEDAFVSGKTPDTAGIISIDEAAIRSKVEAEKFDAEKARLEALKQEPAAPSLPGRKQVAGPNEILYLVQAEASRMAGKPGGQIAQRLLDRFMGGERSYDLFGQMADFVDRIYDPNNVNPQENFIIEKVFGGEKGNKIQAIQQKLNDVRKELADIVKWRNDIAKQLRENEGNELVARQLRLNDHKLGLRQAELTQVVDKLGNEFKNAGPLNPDEVGQHSVRASESLAKQAEADAKQIETERNKRIAEFIEKKRKEWQDGLEGRVDEAKRAEIARQQAEGKLLSTDDAKRYEATATANKADLEILKQDVENLDEEFRALPGVKQKAGMPTEAKAKTAKTPDTIYEMSQDQYAAWLSEGKGNVAGQGAIYEELVKKPEYRQGGKKITKAEENEAGTRLEELEKTKGFSSSMSGWTYTKIGDYKAKLPDGSRLKAYVTLKNWKDLTPELLEKLTDALKKAGYNGQVKVPGAVPFNQWRLVEAFDNIVAHVKDEASLSIFQKEASAIFKDAQITFGKDSPGKSHTDLLATLVNERMADVKAGKNPPELKLEERPTIGTEAAPPTARTPQDIGLTQAEIDHINKELEELDMTTIPSQAEAVKAAAPCAVKIK